MGYAQKFQPDQRQQDQKVDADGPEGDPDISDRIVRAFSRRTVAMS